MINVCILFPGIVRSYEHLAYLQNILDKGQDHDMQFYVFGSIYNFKGNPSEYMEKTKYFETKLDDSKIYLKFHKLEKVDENIHKDNDGFDGRFYAQWLMVKKSFELAKQYAQENNVKYDVVVRCRLDLTIKENYLFSTIKKSFRENKLVFAYNSPTLLKDQFFIGSYSHMSKILDLVDFYYEYFDTEEFVGKRKQFIEHLKKYGSTDHNKDNRINFQSEELLSHRVFKQFDKKNIIVVNRFWGIIRN